MSTKKHIFYNCVGCKYFTSNKTHWNRHIQTEKHGKVLLTTDCQPKKHISHITGIEQKFGCACGKFYTDRSGLWRHRKKCTYSNDNTSDNEIVQQHPIQTTSLAALLQDMMKQNQ